MRWESTGAHLENASVAQQKVRGLKVTVQYPIVMEVLYPTQQLDHQGLYLPCESNEITHMLPLPHEFPTPLQKGPETWGYLCNLVATRLLGQVHPGTFPAQGGSELTMATTHTDRITRKALFLPLLRDPPQHTREQGALPSSHD